MNTLNEEDFTDIIEWIKKWRENHGINGNEELSLNQAIEFTKELYGKIDELGYYDLQSNAEIIPYSTDFKKTYSWKIADDSSKPMVDKNVVSDIIAITYFTRCWIDPEGMLGSNHLLSDDQTKHLVAWADIIDYCFMCLLDGAEEEAFSLYYDYLDGKLDASREHADQGLYRDAEDVVIDMRDKYGL